MTGKYLSVSCCVTHEHSQVVTCYRQHNRLLCQYQVARIENYSVLFILSMMFC